MKSLMAAILAFWVAMELSRVRRAPLGDSRGVPWVI